MAFHELLEKSGGFGRFQFFQIIFLVICNIMVSPQILLENFAGVTPDHRCWVDILDNDAVSDNGTRIFSQESLVRIFIPLDSNLRPEKCRCFIYPQWQLFHLNGTFSNVSEPDTESCMDRWVYDKSSFLSTTVTEWDLVCEYQSVVSVSKFLFMIGAMVGNILNGYLTERFALMVPMFGLWLHLQHLGSNIFLLQAIFGITNFLLCFLVHFLLKFLGLRISQSVSLCLVGIFILGFTGVPQEIQNLHLVLPTLGTAFCHITSVINITYANELLPTTTKATALGIIGIAGGVGGAVAPLLMILRTYHAPLPWIIYAVTAIPAGLAVLFLPETRNQPLPDTIQDLENKRKGLRQGKPDEVPIKVTQF